MLVWGRDGEVAAWVARRIGIDSFGPAAAIGVVRGGHLVAGAVFHAHRHPEIEFSFATTAPGRWATRDAVRTIHRLPFVHLNCRRVCAFVPECNAEARRNLLTLGFRLEGRHPDMLASGAALSFGLLRSDPRVRRWILSAPASPLGPPDLGAIPTAK